MATILPNGKVQFLDGNGKPYAGGTVGFYIPSTLTPKTTWQDQGQTTPNANPLTLDSNGEALIWGSGSYRQILKDSLGNQIWDQVTVDPSSSVSGFLQVANNLSDVANAATALNNLGGASLNSPAFTGTPTAPTAAPGTNTTQLATTAFVTAAIPSRLKTVKVQVFTGSGTYTPSAGMAYCLVHLCGGGGGGAPTSNFGGGGSAGSYSFGVFTAGNIGSSQTVTIGAGGAAGSSGGTSSLGSLMTAPGGNPGTNSPGGSGGTPRCYTGQGGPSGSAGSGGNVNVGGMPGYSGIAGEAQTAPCGGAGGSSMFGAGGIGGNGGSGSNGGYAAGGGGGGGANGGTGGNGICLIIEFCTQ
jgi:hypothetical protein